jgi:plasmid stabilization system protein ParE
LQSRQKGYTICENGVTRLREIRAFIAQDNPEAAGRVATRLVTIIEALKAHPYLGRAGTEPGIRELVVGGTPCVVLCRVRGKRVTILAIHHGAQRKSGPRA